MFLCFERSKENQEENREERCFCSLHHIVQSSAEPGRIMAGLKQLLP